MTHYKPLCLDAWAIPPTPIMLKHGNNYHTCSKCGEPVETVNLKDQIAMTQTSDDEFDTPFGRLTLDNLLTVHEALAAAGDTEDLANHRDKIKRFLTTRPMSRATNNTGNDRHLSETLDKRDALCAGIWNVAPTLDGDQVDDIIACVDAYTAAKVREALQHLKRYEMSLDAMLEIDRLIAELTNYPENPEGSTNTEEK